MHFYQSHERSSSYSEVVNVNSKAWRHKPCCLLFVSEKLLLYYSNYDEDVEFHHRGMGRVCC